MKDYEQFWEALAPAYPVSQGRMRVPIVAELQELEGVDAAAVVSELGTLLQQMLDAAGGAAGAAARAEVAGEPAIVPRLSGDYTGVVRFDCVVDGAGQVKVLELNADYPDGLLLHDATYGVLAEVASTLHRDNYLSLFPTEASVQVLHPKDAGFVDAYHAEVLALQAARYEAVVGGTLSPLPRIVRRCLEVSKEDRATTWPPEAQYLNTYALRTLGYKDYLAAHEHPLVPETLVVEEAVWPQLSENPAQWVLKPGNGCEGEGIYFGRDMAMSAWRALLAQLPAGYIAQQYVALPKRTVPVYENGTVTERELFFDVCPHFFVRAGEVVGNGHVLMRFSESPIVNVSQGGAIGYHRLPG